MVQAAAQREWHEMHPKGKKFHNGDRTSWSDEASESHPYFYEDGVRIWVADTDFDPDDSWRTP